MSVELIDRLEALIAPLDTHQTRKGLLVTTARGLEGYMDIGGDRNAVVPEIISVLRAAALALRQASDREARLREALRPFADVARWFDEMPTDDGALGAEMNDREPLHFTIDGENVQHATLGDLRRARAALATP